ncbi:nuclease domain-containing protein [Armatimonas sp.]|uniref:nuclease domain-containing protein n=1 Tax=Armatimonas sp. TaxID=1872638 RepID=UPI0037515FF7
MNVLILSIIFRNKDNDAKYTNLLKMHAYRDAIRRTAGAYVLYPGNPDGGNLEFQGFHEVLPGLGAFAITPDKEGKPKGIAKLSEFLDQVSAHLAHRTTSREQATYHQREAYRTKEAPAGYGSVRLQESDNLYGNDYRALPPAEELILAAWYENSEQLSLAQSDDGFLYVRLGDRRGALEIHPNLAQVRRAILRTHGSVVAPGMFLLREAGFQVHTRTSLRTKLNQKAPAHTIATWQASPQTSDDENIYALFQVRPDPDSDGISWDGDKLMTLIEAFEADRRNKPITNIGRRSPDPRLLSLEKLLKAQAIPLREAGGGDGVVAKGR